jgi:hypothetical protein
MFDWDGILRGSARSENGVANLVAVPEAACDLHVPERGEGVLKFDLACAKPTANCGGVEGAFGLDQVQDAELDFGQLRRCPDGPFCAVDRPGIAGLRLHFLIQKAILAKDFAGVYVSFIRLQGGPAVFAIFHFRSFSAIFTSSGKGKAPLQRNYRLALLKPQGYNMKH